MFIDRLFFHPPSAAMEVSDGGPARPGGGGGGGGGGARERERMCVHIVCVCTC